MLFPAQVRQLLQVVLLLLEIRLPLSYRQRLQLVFPRLRVSQQLPLSSFPVMLFPVQIRQLLQVALVSEIRLTLFCRRCPRLVFPQ
ncbi:hypothetical protein F4801DRAFT_543159 [Xylaria longipes]|nr:hypothetical protein F4801DRAFT_543159 [Xylaria longipes]